MKYAASSLILSALLCLPGCDSGDGNDTTESSSTGSGPATETESSSPTTEPPQTSSPVTSTTGPVDTTSPGVTSDPTQVTETSADTTSGGSSEGSSGGDVTTSSGPPTVVMETTLGTMVIELFPDESPITVDNFLAYVDAGFYDGTDGLGATTFHRVIPGFVIQGGGLTDSLTGKMTMPPIVNEHSNGLTNDRGTLSMARTTDPDSATSQFFVNVVDNPGLDNPPGYAVFGRVVEGMDIADAIVAVETTTVQPFENVPVEPIVITSVTLE